MSVKAMRRALLIFGLTVLGLLVFAYAGYRYALGYPDRPLRSSAVRVDVTIPHGSNISKISAILQKAGLISSKLAFRVYANIVGKAGRMRSGRYRIVSSITPKKLLETLEKGVPAPQVSVLIPEGKNMLEVAQLLAQKGIADEERLVAKMRDLRFLRRLGVPGKTIEGFILPETYKFAAPTRADEVLRILWLAHKRAFYRLSAKHPQRIKELRTRLGWGHKEIVILASIVEKETGKPSERPLIAGVFLNRLRFASFQPKLLQTDPTIIYGCTVPPKKSPACRSFKGRIRRIHLRDQQNPYSTYAHPGLPPGPISSPGRAAIEAVLKPKKSRYLYFVSKNDGSHYFSATEAQHRHAVDYYQRKRGSPPPPQ